MQGRGAARRSSQTGRTRRVPRARRPGRGKKFVTLHRGYLTYDWRRLSGVAVIDAGRRLFLSYVAEGVGDCPSTAEVVAVVRRSQLRRRQWHYCRRRSSSRMSEGSIRVV